MENRVVSQLSILSLGALLLLMGCEKSTIVGSPGRPLPTMEQLPPKAPRWPGPEAQDHSINEIVLAPQEVKDFSHYVLDEILSPLDKIYLSVNYQSPAWDDSFWLRDKEARMFMFSEASPHPVDGIGHPACRPHCEGADKNVTLKYVWSIPYPIFTRVGDPTREDVGLAVEADLKVNSFLAWNQQMDHPPLAAVKSQLAFVLRLQDPLGKEVQFEISVFQNSEAGDDQAIQDESGRAVVLSSVKKDRPMDFTTADPDLEGNFSSVPWVDYRLFRVHITPQNLQNAVVALNRQGARLDSNVLRYSLLSVAIRLQVHYENNGDAFVIESGVRDFGVYERQL